MTIKELIAKEKFGKRLHITIGYWHGSVGYLLEINHPILNHTVDWWIYKDANSIVVYR